MNVEAENAVMRERARIREEALTKLVDVNATLACDDCGGSGVYQSPENYDPCGKCQGTGFDTDLLLNDYFKPDTKYIKLSDFLSILGGIIK